MRRTYDISVLFKVEVEHYGIQDFCFGLDSVQLLPAKDADTTWKQEQEEIDRDDLDPPRFWHRFAAWRSLNY